MNTMKNLPVYLDIVFAFVTALTFFLFVNAAKRKMRVAMIALVWLFATGLISYFSVFENTTSFPPRFVLLMLPCIMFVLILTIANPGQVVNQFDLRKLTMIHMVRLPVEIVLYGLAAYKTIPELMTFAGRNFDIFSGITAPVIYLVAFRNGKINRNLLLTWNFICLALLVNIVVIAVLSAPFSFQRFAFDQPNIAVLYFPFIWLPAFIVPVVLFSHLVTIRKLLRPVKRMQGDLSGVAA